MRINFKYTFDRKEFSFNFDYIQLSAARDKLLIYKGGQSLVPGGLILAQVAFFEIEA